MDSQNDPNTLRADIVLTLSVLPVVLRKQVFKRLRREPCALCNCILAHCTRARREFRRFRGGGGGGVRGVAPREAL